MTQGHSVFHWKARDVQAIKQLDITMLVFITSSS
jgi:hypothetical protein